MEQPLEKKTQRSIGPPANQRLVFVVDDLNMPQVDEHNTQTAHTLIRQHIDYGHWYDVKRLIAKEVRSFARPPSFLSSIGLCGCCFSDHSRLTRVRR